MGNDSTSLSSTVEPKANTRRGAKRIGYAEVRPDTMDFGLLLAGQNRILQIFIVNNRAKPFSWKADTGGASWLTFEGESSGQIAPHDQQIINVHTDTASLQEGTYLTTLNVVLMDSVKVHIAATMVIVPHSHIKVQNHISPKSPSVVPSGRSTFGISSTQGGTGTMNVTVSQPKENKEPVTWAATSNASWLTLNTFSGVLQPFNTAGDHQQIEVIVDSSALTRGRHQATLSFTASDTFPSTSSPATMVTVQVSVN